VILAIDDDPQVIGLYERYLHPQGYQVVPLSDPTRAVERVKQLKPFAVTLDIMMPGIDGWQVLDSLKGDPDTRNIPVIICSIIEDLEKLAKENKPKMIIAGFSAYSRVWDWQRFREIADSVGAYLFVDMAHVAGLVAAGLYPNPVPIADVVTSTTHKSLRGPRGGIILCKSNPELEKKFDSNIFPGIQGGPLMHVIAAKAVAFKEAMQPEFKVYQQQVIDNARAMAKVFMARGFDVVSGGTDDHLMLVSLIAKGITGKAADAALGRAHITVNKNAVPNDPQSPFVTSGIRVGTPAPTTRGFKEAEVTDVATWMCDVMDNLEDENVIAAVREKVAALCARFPVYS